MVRFGYDSDSDSESSSPPSPSSSTSSHSRAAASIHYDEEEDSEEEAWPVGPPGSIGINGWTDRKGKGRASTALGSTVGRRDGWEEWEDKERISTWVIHRKIASEQGETLIVL